MSKENRSDSTAKVQQRAESKRSMGAKNRMTDSLAVPEDTSPASPIKEPTKDESFQMPTSILKAKGYLEHGKSCIVSERCYLDLKHRALNENARAHGFFSYIYNSLIDTATFTYDSKKRKVVKLTSQKIEGRKRYNPEKNKIEIKKENKIENIKKAIKKLYKMLSSGKSIIYPKDNFRFLSMFKTYKNLIEDKFELKVQELPDDKLELRVINIKPKKIKEKSK